MSNAPSHSQLAEEFMAGFNSVKTEIRRSIENFSSDSTLGSSVSDGLNKLSNEIQKLSKSLHDAALFLPPYSIKMRQNEIRDLEKLLKDKEDALIPRKKFGFKSKAQPDAEVELKPSKVVKPELTADPKSLAAADSNFVTIENLQNCTVTYEEKTLNGCDVLVRELDNVILHLHGSPSTLRISNVTNSKILCGPITTSAFVENVNSSVLFLCCKQLRTHSSENTDVYLRVRSRAIIEDCKNIRFAPYVWKHPRSKELHERAEIPYDSERYDAVDDFNWLSASQSPNWSILPKTERIIFPTAEV